MKTPSCVRRGRKSGFTLVELLVVIAIIAVLAAAGFTVGSKAINNARELKSKAVAQQIELGVNSFYSDYSSVPDVGAKVTTDSGEGVRLLNILAGLDSASENPRKTKYVTLPEGSGNRDGAMFTPGGAIRGLFDPWGSPYTVFLDQDYEEKVTVSLGNTNRTLNGRRVAVASPGADKEWGTKDDVKTW